MNRTKYYRDLRDWLMELEKNDMLHHINQSIIKETEISPLVRLQYRGLAEEDRKGFLFEKVTDVKSRKYDVRVATGVYASSLKMYAMGLLCEANREDIAERWRSAQDRPIVPVSVNSSPAQELVCTGGDLLKDGEGIEWLPIPVELPGFSGQIRTTTHLITRDANSDWRNMGNYSAHVFGKTKLLWEIGRGQHGYLHWQSWKEKGKPMPAAIVIGGPPSFFYLAGTKLPYGVDELAVAGGFAGEPIELVKCKTVDLEVPAHAEIIIEGLISNEHLEPGNSFGEYTGYMATDIYERPIFNVTAITRRKDAIYVHIVSQFAPSESSKIRAIGYENVFLKTLKQDLKIPGILDIAWHELSGSTRWCVIKIDKVNNAHSWQVLYCANGCESREGKYYIVVDKDIDPHDLDAVIWALCFRVQPDRDTQVVKGRIPGLDISAYQPDAPYNEKLWPRGVGSSALLIDATMKYPYPPTALPRKDFMERARVMWDQLGLPKLNLKEPWYGYELGYWPEEYKEDADLTIKGEHYKIGEKLGKRRIKIKG